MPLFNINDSKNADQIKPQYIKLLDFQDEVYLSKL